MFFAQEEEHVMGTGEKVSALEDGGKGVDVLAIPDTRNVDVIDLSDSEHSAVAEDIPEDLDYRAVCHLVDTDQVQVSELVIDDDDSDNTHVDVPQAGAKLVSEAAPPLNLDAVDLPMQRRLAKLPKKAKKSKKGGKGKGKKAKKAKKSKKGKGKKVQGKQNKGTDKEGLKDKTASTSKGSKNKFGVTDGNRKHKQGQQTVKCDGNEALQYAHPQTTRMQQR